MCKLGATRAHLGFADPLVGEFVGALIAFDSRVPRDPMDLKSGPLCEAGSNVLDQRLIGLRAPTPDQNACGVGGVGQECDFKNQGRYPLFQEDSKRGRWR